MTALKRIESVGKSRGYAAYRAGKSILPTWNKADDLENDDEAREGYCVGFRKGWIEAEEDRHKAERVYYGKTATIAKR